MRRTFTFTVLLLGYAVGCFAAKKLACDEFTESNDVEDYELADLMNVPLFLSASQQAECSHSAASIVTSVSGEDLLNMGARDLIDALDLVPGFNFGGVMSNIVGLGIRGITSDEGKLSVMIDGVMLTEQRFGITTFGSHFPVEQIDRIEVIRGPGSILHGNFAELGVINIITKQGHQLNGGVMGGSYGRFEHGEARKNGYLTAGKQWDDLEMSFYGKYTGSHRSDQIYQDAYGNTFDMADNNELESLLGNFSIRYKDLSLRVLIDEYTADSRDSYADEIEPANKFLRNRFATYAANLAYQHEFSDFFKIDSGFDFSRQTPWHRTSMYTDGRPNRLEEKVSVDNYKFDIKATFSVEGGHYLAVGNSFQFQDYQHDKSSFTGTLPLFGDYTAYAEAVYKTDWVNILAGLRFDWYSQYGTNLAPRLALTKKIGSFHYKALYSHAFHAPVGGNYQLNAEYNQGRSPDRQVDQIRPEKTYTYEFELGYQLQRNLDITANVFYTHIDNFFIYTFDENYDDFYINANPQATRGIEAALNYQHIDWGRFKLSYGFYQAVQDASTDYKMLDTDGNLIHKRMNIGFPSHKVSVNHTFPITPALTFNHTLIFSSDRYGYSGGDLVHHKPIWVYNTYLRYQPSQIKDLEAGLGFYDVFNAQYDYVQLFNGAHPALPGNSREVLLKLSYAF